MELGAFFDAVESDPVMCGAHIDTDKQEIAVEHLLTRHLSIFSVRTVLEQPWDTLRAIIVEDREAQVLTHMSRVIGYYSRTDNWNPSKKAELRDRQKGNYALT